MARCRICRGPLFMVGEKFRTWTYYACPSASCNFCIVVSDLKKEPPKVIETTAAAPEKPPTTPLLPPAKGLQSAPAKPKIEDDPIDLLF